MSERAINAYGFASDAQWDLCLAVGCGTQDGGGISLPNRWGTHARRIVDTGLATAVASDRFGQPLWRSKTSLGEEGIAWLDELDALHGPNRVDAVLAGTHRLQVDRHWLWAFAQDRLVRFHRGDLQRDMTLAAGAMVAGEGATILDIALDGRDGLWVLLETAGRQGLAHLDCRGCVRVTMALPCEINAAAQLAVADSGKTIVLLCPAERRLALLDAAQGKLLRMLWLGSLDPCFNPERLASDTGNHIVLSGVRQGAGGAQWCLFLLDRFGETMRPALSDIFRAPDARQAAEVEVLDFAVSNDGMWFATSDGLWTLDADASSGSTEAQAALLTPLLYAPPGSGDTGWLRAEIEIDLPEGSAVTASFATTDDPRIADRIAIIAADENQPKRARLETIWSLLDQGTGAQRGFTAIGGGDFPGHLSIPLFGTSDHWLAVRLEIDVPPFVDRPKLKSLRILYPDRSLMRRLPAIFSDPANDPERLLRRLVGVIEATSQAIDEKIGAIGSYIDSGGAPAEWLDYLGSWLDLPWHPALEESSKRALLREAGCLLQWRGTTRGLLRLVECVSGEGAVIAITDVAAERPLVRLGGKGMVGSTARGLLAGRSRTTATLGGKAVLGRARLGCSTDAPGPLDILVPLLILTIDGDAAIKTANAPYLDDVIAQYAPVGLRHRVRWTANGARNADDIDALVLDAKTPGMLGADSTIGRTVLGGRPRTEIGTGFHMGFQIR